MTSDLIESARPWRQHLPDGPCSEVVSALPWPYSVAHAAPLPRVTTIFRAVVPCTNRMNSGYVSQTLR